MEIKQKKREEIEEKYKWDLSSIYSSKEEIDNDISKVITLSNKLIEYKDKKLNINELKELLDLNVNLNRISDKLMAYSMLKTCEDGSNSCNQELYGTIVNLITKVLADISFIQNKILNLDEKIINEVLNSESLKEYKFFLEDMIKIKPHTLSDSEEKILSSLSKSLILDEETYDNLTNVDMKFGSIINEEGKEVELTNSNCSLFLKSKDRNIRKEAFKKFYSVFGNYTTTISGLYSSHLETNNIICNLRKYSSVLDSELFNDNLPKSIYDNLISVINSNLNFLHEYYKIKKEVIGLDEFHIYDINAPIKNYISKKYTYEEAKELILYIFKIMGDDYLEILNKAFNNRWIDVYNNVGKKNGAFSTGVYDTNPYILMNFEGEFNDISGLVHELGHLVHTYLSKENNIYLYYDYSLFVAEVASLTNEIIFNVKMIDMVDDNNIKLYIINNLLRLFNSNLYDATLEAEFELDVHEKVQNGDVLTSDYFNNLYLELNKKYYGNNVVVDEEIKYKWEIYSHLYVDYYLFKYATGISCASFCASKILSGDKIFIEKYKNFLKLGASVYPKEALKSIDIDISNKGFIENAIDFYKDLLNKFKSTYDLIK